MDTIPLFMIALARSEVNSTNRIYIVHLLYTASVWFFCHHPTEYQSYNHVRQCPRRSTIRPPPWHTSQSTDAISDSTPWFPPPRSNPSTLPLASLFPPPSSRTGLPSSLASITARKRSSRSQTRTLSLITPCSTYRHPLAYWSGRYR